ncbi:MAG TPA: TonB-dependent receptor, partial [Myxococcota bacterium]|nr:TonB-dependent receptor [Myxococcota bacterium]
EPAPDGGADEVAPTDAAPPGGAPAFRDDPYGRIVVSASRVSQDPLDSPSAVTILTADDIKHSGATTIGDALRRVPGVDVMSLAASSPSVGIRGFNGELSNKVLWLVDGRTVYWDFLASPLPLNLGVSLDDIDRIEIIRGPGSAIYGANAFTGVINIITRTPGEQPRTHLSIAGGTPRFLQGTASTDGRKAWLSWRLSAGYEQDGRWAEEGWPTGDGAPVRPFLARQDLSMRKVRATGRLDARFLDHGYASLSGGFTDGTMEFYNLGALGNYGLAGTSHYLRGDLAWGAAHLLTYWNHEDVRTGPWLQVDDPTRSLDAHVDNDVVHVEIEGSPSFVTGDVHHQVNLSAGYRYRSTAFDYLQGGFDQPWVEHHFWMLAQEQLRWRALGVVASLRVDRHPLLPISKTLSPRLAVLLRVTPTTSLRLSGGTAYRAMNAVESYMDFALDTSVPGYYLRDYGGETNPASPGLSPERIVNVELGVHDTSSRYHRADAAVYWNRVTDLIGLADVTPSLAPFDPARNGWEAGTTGWVNQTDLTYDAIGGEAEVVVFPVDGLDVFGNVALERVLERGPTGVVPDGSTSLAKVNLGGTWRAPVPLDVSFAVHYTSPQSWRLRAPDATGTIVVNESPIPARWLMSARVGGRPIPGQGLEVALTLWNPLGFTEDRFQEHPKGQPVGGRLYGTVSYDF